MGVIRNFGNNVSRFEDDWIYLSSDGEESSVNVNSVPNDEGDRKYNQRTKKSLSKQINKSTKPQPTFMGLGVKGKSHKKFRRYANANLFMTELGSIVNENDFEEISISDFIPQSTSPFALLLQQLDSDNYDSFINDEDEKDLDDEIELEHYSLSEEPELECTGLDAKKCFSRIDQKLRKQLLKKHVPLGILASIEENLVDFFTDNPTSIYKTNIQCSFKRFLLHACCQYNNLKCQSFTLNGKRLTYVKNRRKCFIKPVKYLSQYLESIQ